ncbi:hypothetical protein [Bosea sp. ASV33]|uniref:hypothetical protein n=1 Tax=Bosea sp. ASV33 TaxID=2795106 RepID=UPI0018EDA7B2|nr:hypothetical protein [Bosea sp. ASV33]
MPTLWGVLALAAPIILANASTLPIGFVDAAIIGLFGDATLIGGVAVGAAIYRAIDCYIAFCTSARRAALRRPIATGCISLTSLVQFHELDQLVTGTAYKPTSAGR